MSEEQDSVDAYYYNKRSKSFSIGYRLRATKILLFFMLRPTVTQQLTQLRHLLSLIQRFSFESKMTRCHSDVCIPVICVSPSRVGGTPIHYLYGYVPPNGVVILKLLIYNRTRYPFQRRFLERGIIFRTHDSSSFVSSHLKLFKDRLLLKIRLNALTSKPLNSLPLRTEYKKLAHF